MVLTDNFTFDDLEIINKETGNDAIHFVMRLGYNDETENKKINEITEQIVEAMSNQDDIEDTHYGIIEELKKEYLSNP